jgi:hypothetical protein
MTAPERDEFFSRRKLWAGVGGEITKVEPRGKREEVSSQGMKSKDSSIISRTAGGQTRTRD